MRLSKRKIYACGELFVNFKFVAVKPFMRRFFYVEISLFPKFFAIIIDVTGPVGGMVFISTSEEYMHLFLCAYHPNNIETKGVIPCPFALTSSE